MLFLAASNEKQAELRMHVAHLAGKYYGYCESLRKRLIEFWECDSRIIVEAVADAIEPELKAFKKVSVCLRTQRVFCRRIFRNIACMLRVYVTNFEFHENTLEDPIDIVISAMRGSICCCRSTIYGIDPECSQAEVKLQWETAHSAESHTIIVLAWRRHPA